MKYFKILLSIDNNDVDHEIVNVIYDNDFAFNDVESEETIEEVKDVIISNIIDSELGVTVLTMNEMTPQELDAELDSITNKQIVQE